MCEAEPLTIRVGGWPGKPETFLKGGGKAAVEVQPLTIKGCGLAGKPEAFARGGGKAAVPGVASHN